MQLAAGEHSNQLITTNTHHDDQRGGSNLRDTAGRHKPILTL